jgi:putative transposase
MRCTGANLRRTRDSVTTSRSWSNISIARARDRSFLPPAIEKFQRRAPELAMLIREAFLRGISTRQVGRVVATLTGETVSAQTVSNLTRDLDGAVKQFHQAPLKDKWTYLFLDGVALKVRRPAGRQHVQMLVAYGVRLDGTRQLLGFLRTRGESQAHWEALLNDLYRRGLKGDKLLLAVTDSCPGLAAAIQTVYPRAAHQRCWVHKMRNILEKVRKRDYDAVKADAQAIYLTDGRRQAVAAARAFCRRWRSEYPSVVKQLERDLPELLASFAFPKHLWRKLRTTNIIERGLSKSGEEPGPWSASSTSNRWTESSTPSSRDSTWNGKLAPSAYLRKRLDITTISSITRRGIPAGHATELLLPNSRQGDALRTVRRITRYRQRR